VRKYDPLDKTPWQQGVLLFGEAPLFIRK